jgi:hypothetical protein
VFLYGVVLCVCVCGFFLLKLFSLPFFFLIIFPCSSLSIFLVSEIERERGSERGWGDFFLFFFSLSLFFLSLLAVIFFYIFSAWNTTIWEAVWLSLLLLETWCEKICVDLYLLNVFLVLLYYCITLFFFCCCVLL